MLLCELELILLIYRDVYDVYLASTQLAPRAILVFYGSHLIRTEDLRTSSAVREDGVASHSVARELADSHCT